MNYKYCNPVEFTDNVLATQIVNASRQLAETQARIEQVQLAYKLSSNKATLEQIKELFAKKQIISDDIRKLAKGNIIQA